MMKLTMHGLFLTCTQTFYLYIFLTYNQLFRHNLSHQKVEGKNPTYFEGRCLAHGGESPSTLVPCLVSTALPLLSNPTSPLPTPLAHMYYITMTPSTISVFLVWNNYGRISLGLTGPKLCANVQQYLIYSMYYTRLH